jgi:DNA-binding HxlR family transcriptional regulator
MMETPKVEHALTELGRCMEPALPAMLAWGKPYQSRSPGRMM